MNNNVLICVAWPYCNGTPHLGHIAGAYLPPDIFARYQRLRGRNVLVVSGSDTHGTPITIRADEEGITPEQVIERYHPQIIALWQALGITFDLFTHTDTENHWAVTQDLFLRHLEKGYLYKDTQLVLYSEVSKRFLPDRYVEGTCPICGYPNARGDQCDNCGNTLDAIDLINPRSKIDGSTPVPRETEHFFLDLAKLNGPLLDWINEDKEHWRPQVLNSTKATLQSGELRGRPITRDILWGVTIPLTGYADKRIYVWYDAVIGYLSATKEWAKITAQPDAWKPWWEDPTTRSYYFIGKDNIPFHALIWPAMLYAYGGLNLPYDVPANEYLNVEGAKLSKSRHWIIDARDVLTRYDVDAVRYVLTANAPETRDFNFTWEEFVRRNNDELVATWGNLANRVLSFADRRFESKVPEPRLDGLDEADKAILARVEAAFQTTGDLYEAVKLKAAVGECLAVAQDVNRYLNDKAPWTQIKTDPGAAATSIYVSLRCIDSLKTLLTPVLPFSSQKLHEYLGYDGSLLGRQYTEVIHDERGQHLALRYDASTLTGRWEPSQLQSGQALRTPQPLFKKLELSIVDEEVARLGAGG